MRRRVAWLVMVLGLLVGSGSAEAATLQVDALSGKLTGASGVTIVGITGTFSVEFVDGPCLALFSGCTQGSLGVFGTTAEAQAAAQALLDQVFIDGPQGGFDSDETLTSGCTSVPARACYAYVPTAANAGNIVQAAFARNQWIDLLDGAAAGGGVIMDDDFVTEPAAVWARFSPAVPVPEPTTLTLLGLGCAGLGFARRRRRG